MNHTFTAKEPTSEQQVADLLRDRILAGDLPVGEFLSQRKLAELVGFSVISVRGALRQLENEGLLENIPHCGVRIPKETGAVIRDRYFVRTVLENAVVEQICGKLDGKAAEKLEELAEELDRLAEDRSDATIRRFAELHQEFHLLLAESAGSPLLVQLLRRVIHPSRMILNARRTWEVSPGTHGNHRILMDAILQGPADAAAQIMQDHIRAGLDSELAAL